MKPEQATTTPIYRCLECGHQRSEKMPECPRDGKFCRVIEMEPISDRLKAEMERDLDRAVNIGRVWDQVLSTMFSPVTR